jgi:HD superfamily phosphohydrolase
MSSEIPNILKSHNYDVGSIVNLSDFLLLEREAPDLCADRLDYTLRDSATYHGNVSIIKNILSHIKTHDNIIVVDNADVAKELSLLYLELNRCYWANPKELVLSEILADAIKLSYEQGFISFEDFFGDDKYLFEKIKENKNKKVSDLMRSLESPFSIQYVTESDDYDYCCKGKLRTIDPIALTNSGPRRVSEIFPTFKDTLQNHNRHFLAGQYIKVVK